MTKSIALIGGGPKAVAIAAKAKVLRTQGREEVKVTVFEKTGIGANWAGMRGYTDGAQRLCTAAERDLGFPYDTGLYDRGIAERMFAEFSWGAFLVADAGAAPFKGGLSDWINRGRLPPTHAEFARYLQWAHQRSEARLVLGEVTEVKPRREADGWNVHATNGAARATRHGPFNGVVFTGPGPAQARLTAGLTDTRVVDGAAFWINPETFAARANGSDDPVVIIGAGGTAAAIAAWFVRKEPERTLIILGDQAALFTRSDSFFESQMFNDEEIWERLDQKVRDEFTRRLNRGVVWATVSDELARSPKVRFEPGRASQVVIDPHPPHDIDVDYVNGAGAQTAHASLVVDASGFDAWWFRRLLPQALRDKMEGADDEASRVLREGLIAGMKEDFTLLQEAAGRLHAPMLSQSIGPGFSTLMVLGAMSERILKPYSP